MLVPLSEKTLQRLANVTALYMLVKEMIIYFEEMDDEQFTDIQSINELRSALDHLMRSTAAHLGMKEFKGEDTAEDYALKNIDKAYGHIFRAGYDIIDWMALSLKGLIVNELEHYSTSSITTVIPRYYAEIRPAVEALNIEIAEFRINKDVGPENSDNLREYFGTVKQLRGYYKDILVAKSSLDDFDRKHKSEKSRAEFKSLSTKVIGGLLVAAICYTVGVWYGQSSVTHQTPLASATAAENPTDKPSQSGKRTTN